MAIINTDLTSDNGTDENSYVTLLTTILIDMTNISDKTQRASDNVSEL